MNLNSPVLHEIVNNLYEGVLITDSHNQVIYTNDAYTRITGVRREDILHTDLKRSRPGSRMDSVLASGRAEIGLHRIYGNRAHVTNIVPVYSNGTLIGGISILNSIHDLMNISKKLEEHEKKLFSLEKKLERMKVTQFSFDTLIAVDPLSMETKELAMRLAGREIPILITGESGTGKEVYAQAIHNASPRRLFPFMAINCSAIHPNMIESELFGYEGSAFTGACKDGKKGIFEAANGGTVFLDEIGDLDFHLQAKLLRVLQENTVRPVSSTRERKIDIRIISATNRDLSQMLLENTFRLDLYYRIATTILNLAPLRSRKEDIMPLVHHTLRKEGKKNKKSFTLDENTTQLLRDYPWPGNIRELTNAITAAAILCETETIIWKDFPKIIQEYIQDTGHQDSISLKEIVRKAEEDAIKKSLAKYGHSTSGKQTAAQALGISVATLYNKMNGTQDKTFKKNGF